MRSIVRAVVLTGAVFACTGKEKGSAPPAVARVHVCRFITQDQVEAAIGPLTSEPQAQPAQGPFLGGCQYPVDGGVVVAAASTADGFEAAVADARDATEVAGLGERAVASKTTGVYVKVPGKPYFLHFIALVANGIDTDKAVALAKVIVPNAK